MGSCQKDNFVAIQNMYVKTSSLLHYAEGDQGLGHVGDGLLDGREGDAQLLLGLAVGHGRALGGGLTVAEGGQLGSARRFIASSPLGV